STRRRAHCGETSSCVGSTSTRSSAAPSPSRASRFPAAASASRATGWTAPSAPARRLSCRVAAVCAPASLLPARCARENRKVKAPSCAALLLAGGTSTRMGFPKALANRDGAPLWRVQMDKLAELHPAETFFSAPRDLELPL